MIIIQPIDETEIVTCQYGKEARVQSCQLLSSCSVNLTLPLINTITDARIEIDIAILMKGVCNMQYA